MCVWGGGGVVIVKSPLIALRLEVLYYVYDLNLSCFYVICFINFYSLGLPNRKKSL